MRVQLREWLRELLLMQDLRREQEAMHIRLLLVEEDVRDLIDKDELPVALTWAQRAYRD